MAPRRDSDPRRRRPRLRRRPRGRWRRADCAITARGAAARRRRSPGRCGSATPAGAVARAARGGLRPGRGAQVVETAFAFSGADLRFAAAGPAGVAIDPRTGALVVPIDRPVSGAPVAVTAANSGGAAVAWLPSRSRPMRRRGRRRPWPLGAGRRRRSRAASGPRRPGGDVQSAPALSRLRRGGGDDRVGLAPIRPRRRAGDRRDRCRARRAPRDLRARTAGGRGGACAARTRGNRRGLAALPLARACGAALVRAGPARPRSAARGGGAAAADAGDGARRDAERRTAAAVQRLRLRRLQPEDRGPVPVDGGAQQEAGASLDDRRARGRAGDAAAMAGPPRRARRRGSGLLGGRQGPVARGGVAMRRPT